MGGINTNVICYVQVIANVQYWKSSDNLDCLKIRVNCNKVFLTAEVLDIGWPLLLETVSSVVKEKMPKGGSIYITCQEKIKMCEEHCSTH